MRRVFAVLATVLMVAVVAQFFLAASGAFDTAPNDESFSAHRALGYLIFLFAIVLTIVAALARLPGRLIGACGLVAGLVIVQSLIAVIAKAFGETGSSTAAGELVFGLHAFGALAIMGVTGTIVRQARRPSGGSVAARPQEPTRQAS